MMGQPGSEESAYLQQRNNGRLSGIAGHWKEGEVTKLFQKGQRVPPNNKNGCCFYQKKREQAGRVLSLYCRRTGWSLALLFSEAIALAHVLNVTGI